MTLELAGIVMLTILLVLALYAYDKKGKRL
jgi:hypothetical protein